MVQAATNILSVSEPSISQQSQIKEDTVEPSVPAREFNLKAYAAITWHNDPTSLGLEPRLTDHRSHRDATKSATGAGLVVYGNTCYIIVSKQLLINITNNSVILKNMFIELI